MQRFCFGDIHGAAQQVFQVLSQADQPQQGLVCSEVDQEVKVATGVLLPLGDGAIDAQVGGPMAARHSENLDQLLGGVDVGLHDRVAPSGGHHQIHYGAKAVGELFLKYEVSVDQLSGLVRLEFNQ
jgi:hypothetical protein